MSSRPLKFAFVILIVMSKSNLFAGLIFTEVMYNPTIDSGVQPAVYEWIEIFNAGPTTVNLNEYNLKGLDFGTQEYFNWYDGGDLPSVSIASNEAIILYNEFFDHEPPYLHFDEAWYDVPTGIQTVAILDWIALSDDLETLSLIEIASGDVTSIVEFTDAPWPDPAKGYSIFLKDLNDPLNSASWDTHDPVTLGMVGIDGLLSSGDLLDTEYGDYGSPGFVTFPTSAPMLPEPTSAAIFGSMLVMTFGIRRRRKSM